MCVKGAGYIFKSLQGGEGDPSFHSGYGFHAKIGLFGQLGLGKLSAEPDLSNPGSDLFFNIGHIKPPFCNHRRIRTGFERK